MAHLAALPAIAKVVGVDGVLKALETFALEHPELEIKPAVSDGTLQRLIGNKVELLHGDFFELDDKVTGGRFDVIYDRASLVAINPSLRAEYVETMGKLLKPGGLILLVTLTRQDENGPPFSTPDALVQQMYGKQSWVESVNAIGGADPETNEDGSVQTSTYFLIKAKE